MIGETNNMTNIKPAKRDLNTIYIGCDAFYLVTLPYSITNYGFVVELKHAITGEKTNFEIDIDPTNKKVGFSLPNVITSELQSGTYSWKFIQTDNNGYRSTLIFGNVSVEAT